MKKTIKFIQSFVFLFILIFSNTTQVFAQTTPNYPYEKYFVITAYYSPIEGQKHYIKGSLEADRRLNGNGTNGADGTPVFPGMVAAPKNYAFGTKMKIEGIGTVAVHDRGGAIISADPNQQNSYDRLDIWMGHGDQGLARAMQWGKRKVKVTVYGIDPSIEEKIDLSFLDSQISTNQTLKTKNFSTDLSLNEDHPEVSKLKEALTISKLYNGPIDTKFDAATQNAVIKLQIENGIIDDANDYAAGYVGPKTRQVLEKILSENSYSPTKPIEEPNIKTANASNQNIQGDFLATDLKIGDNGEAVKQLQIELNKFNLFALEPTGYYGEVTAHAVFKFQQIQGLAGDKSSPGAGSFGPITRSKMANLINQRTLNHQLIAQKNNLNNFTSSAKK